MKVDQSAIAGILAKVERAHEHFSFLQAEITAYDGRQPKPYRLEPEVRANGAKHFLRLRFIEPIPPVWSVVLGEAIHDLRSALDQAVYWLTVDFTGHSLERTQFPIFRQKARFEETSRRYLSGTPASGLYQIRGVGPGPHAFIEQLQPYPQRRGPLHKSIRALQDFWNQDKHRLVHLWGIRIGESKLTVSSPTPNSHCVPWLSPRVLHEGAIAVRVTCDPPAPHVEVHGESVTNVAVQDPGRARGGALLLWEMFWDTGAVVGRLLNAIGRQDEPVPLQAIPEPSGFMARFYNR